MKVLTFNCWAIGYVPFMTKDRKQRVTAIAQYLAKGILILESFFYFDSPTYSVPHIITNPSKELCSKMALGEVGVSFP